MALDQLVHRRRRRQPHRPRGSDHRRILQHQLAKLEIGALARQRHQLAPCITVFRLGKPRYQRSPDQGRIIGGGQGRPLPRAGRIDHRRIEGDRQLDLGLDEGGIALRNDADQQNRQKAQGDDDRGDSIETEALFDGITSLKPGVGPFRRSPKPAPDPPSQSYFSRYFRTTFRATTFKARVTGTAPDRAQRPTRSSGCRIPDRRPTG